MTLRSLICFSVAAASLAAATVTGRMSTSGVVGNVSPDIVVWLEPETQKTDEPAASTHARLLQKNKTFQPHVLAIQVNTLVDFPNADPIFHNAFSNYDGQIFDIGLYPPGTSRAVRFRRPGIVRIFCNIHPAMSAVIVVLDTPYFTVTKPGQFSIPNVEPGTYTLHVFDERATGTQGTLQTVSITGAATQQLPDIHIAENGYVQPSHKNKYGQDYAPGADTYGAGGPPK